MKRYDIRSYCDSEYICEAKMAAVDDGDYVLYSDVQLDQRVQYAAVSMALAFMSFLRMMFGEGNSRGTECDRWDINALGSTVERITGGEND